MAFDCQLYIVSKRNVTLMITRSNFIISFCFTVNKKRKSLLVISCLGRRQGINCPSAFFENFEIELVNHTKLTNTWY